MILPNHLHDNWVEQGWGAAAPGLAAVMELDRAHRMLLNRADEILRQFDLSVARYEVLQLLWFARYGQMSVTRLSRLLQVHSTSVTSAVDRLAGARLVQRHRDPGDARGAAVVITTRGRTIAKTATEHLNAELFEDLGLTPEQHDVLWAVLRSLRSNAGDFLPSTHQGGKRTSLPEPSATKDKRKKGT